MMCSPERVRGLTAGCDTSARRSWPMPFAGPLLVLLAGMLGVALVPLLFVG
jgi:hypothetical protein